MVLKQGVLAGEAVAVAAFASSDQPRPLRLDLLHNKPPTTTTHFSHHQSFIVSESRYTYRQLRQLTKQSNYRYVLVFAAYRPYPALSSLPARTMRRERVHVCKN